AKGFPGGTGPSRSAVDIERADGGEVAGDDEVAVVDGHGIGKPAGELAGDPFPGRAGPAYDVGAVAAGFGEAGRGKQLAVLHGQRGHTDGGAGPEGEPLIAGPRGDVVGRGVPGEDKAAADD